MAFLALLATMLLAGCASQKLAPAILAEIPADANRIYLEADPELPPEPEVTVRDLFSNTIATLAEHGYVPETVDYDTYVLTTEPRQIRDDLAVRILVNATERELGTGPHLVASAQWALTVMTAPELWQEASWTDGREKAAFEEAMSVLHDVQFTVSRAETDLGVVKEAS